MKQRIILLTVIVCFSCSCNENQKTHDRLLSWESQYVMEDGEKANGYYNDRKNFLNIYFSEKQVGDTLILTTLKEINACGKTIGDIEFSGDTLFLNTRQIADEVCASVVFSKFTYNIFNPTKKKYKIVSEK